MLSSQEVLERIEKNLGAWQGRPDTDGILVGTEDTNGVLRDQTGTWEDIQHSGATIHAVKRLNLSATR